MALRPPPLSNSRKAAILLVALGPDAATQLFQHMSQDQVEALTIEIARMGRVPPKTCETVIEEFHDLCLGRKLIAEGGLDAARGLLMSAFGPDRADQIVDRVMPGLQDAPFGFLKKADAAQIVTLLQNEHPQTIALILAYLPPGQSAAVLSGLPQDLRADVARRLATLGKTPPEVVREVEQVLHRRVSSVAASDFSDAGGVQSLVEVLNRVDRATEKTILESLSRNNPELAARVKKRMFVFEDVLLLDDHAIQKVLKEVETGELSLALKGVDEAVQARLFKNLPERAVATIQEEMELAGPVRRRAVEEAQQRVVGIARRLAEAGEIILARGGDEEMIK